MHASMLNIQCHINPFIMLRYLVVASFILLPVIGMTWAFGLFAVNENTFVSALLFTIFNTLQVRVLHIVGKSSGFHRKNHIKEEKYVYLIFNHHYDFL